MPLTIVEKTEQYGDELAYVVPLLDSKYGECDSQGHKQPDFGSNSCGYCFRHLKYGTPRADRFRDETKGQFNAPIVMQKRREELSHQKAMDRLDGLHKLIAELKN